MTAKLVNALEQRGLDHMSAEDDTTGGSSGGSANSIQYSEAAGVFGRHLVGLEVHCPEEWPEPLLLTTFIHSFEDRWKIVTAGHVIEDLGQRLGQTKGKVLARLLDANGLDVKDRGGIVPYVLNLDEWTVVDGLYGFDCAFSELRPYYVKQLRTNNVEPLPPDCWWLPEMGGHGFVLAGFPSQPAKPAEGQYELTVHGLLLVPKPTPSDTLKVSETSCERLHFQVTLTEDISDIDGMSGGPVFAVKHGENKTGYRLVGIQSFWWKSIQTLSVCPMHLLPEILSKHLESAAK